MPEPLPAKEDGRWLGPQPRGASARGPGCADPAPERGESSGPEGTPGTSGRGPQGPGGGKPGPSPWRVCGQQSERRGPWWTPRGSLEGGLGALGVAECEGRPGASGDCRGQHEGKATESPGPASAHSSSQPGSVDAGGGRGLLRGHCPGSSAPGSSHHRDRPGTLSLALLRPTPGPSPPAGSAAGSGWRPSSQPPPGQPQGAPW